MARLSSFIEGNTSILELIRNILQIDLDQLSPNDLSTLRNKIESLINSLRQREIAKSCRKLLRQGWFATKVLRLEVTASTKEVNNRIWNVEEFDKNTEEKEALIHSLQDKIEFGTWKIKSRIWIMI